jgi:arylsulfatase A-like enzyme
MVYNGHAIPPAILDAIIHANGGKEFPTNTTPNTARDVWTTKALTDTLWKNGVPRFSLLWLSEPDASQHANSPGSETALAGVGNSDSNLAAVLRALEKKGVREQTDVLVVSDHGFSSIQRGVDLVTVLTNAHFKATRKLDDPEAGDIMVVGLGGSALFYVIDHDEPVTRRLVQFLQGTDFASVIFSRLPMPGTFSLKQVHLDSGNEQPDVAAALRWNNEHNDFGAPGMLVADSGKKGSGTHGSLSPFDLHNTLVASGPDFRRGWIDELPTGNADVAPTVLWILGVKPASAMDGRVLTEALAAREDPTAKPEQQTIDAETDLGPFRWRQYLKYTTYGKQFYIDEGNGACRLR